MALYQVYLDVLPFSHSHYRFNHGLYLVLLSFYFMEWNGEHTFPSISCLRIIFSSLPRQIFRIAQPSLIFFHTFVVSGQICSVSKSKLFFSRNTPSETQHSISSFTNIPIVQDLGKYLGMPLLTKRKSSLAFQPLLDKIHTHICAWQSKLLSQVGRLTLIKSVLSPLTYYQMQTFVLPRSITSNIDKSIRDFLWGDTLTQRHVHLIK